MIVSFALKNQIIRRTDYNIVVAQSKNYLRARFDALSDDWIGPITAIFNEYTVLLDGNNECLVPWEVLQNPGVVNVSAFCGDLHTASVATMVVKPSGYVDGETPEPPTPGVYVQLTGLVQNAVDTANSVQQRADAGEFDGKDGTDGKDGADGQDGFSPIADVQQTTDGATITITDKTGTTTAAVRNGEDGFSTIAAVEQTDDGAVITITDKSGTTTAIAHNGRDGTDGLDAPQIDDTQASPTNPWSGEKVATELEGYAPIESAIQVSGTGTGLVSLSPTIAWGLQGLQLYGRTTQDGTPSPESPVPVVSAGDGGNVDMTVSGANIFDVKNVLFYPNPDLTGNNQNWSIDDEGVITGAVSGDGTYMSQIIDRGSYVVSFRSNSKFYSIRAHRASDGSEIAEFPIGSSYEPGETKNIVLDIQEPFILNIRPGVFTPPLMISDFMVCPGDTAPSAFVPYAEPQSITLSTPNGLPGIPVASGGNYTDASGQQYISNILDFSTGMETVAVAKIDSYNGEEIPGAYMSTTGELTTGATVLYALAEPYTQPIPAETMAAYKALTAYSSTTNIIATDCGIQATAIADGTMCIKQIIQRLAALESAATNL